MRPLVVLSFLAAALLVGACASSVPPGWTFSPPTAAPSPAAGAASPGVGSPAAASPEASGPASPAASGAASPAASGPASGAPGSPSAGAPSGAGGAVVNITAQNIDFTSKQVSAPANAPFTIHFDNQDASVPHDVVIKDSTGMAMFTGDLVTGVAQKDYSVPALAAGTYTFACSVHSNMTGTLTVQ